MTTTSLPTRPGPAHQLLDSIIHNHLDRLDIKAGQAVLEVGAGPGEITARLAQLVGRDGSVTAVDADTNQLAPTSIIDIYRRDPNRDLLPGTADSYDHIVARWPHGPLRDPVDVVQQMIARLRPGGTLALASITPTSPRIYRTPSPEDAHLIRTVMHHVRSAVAGPRRLGDLDQRHRGPAAGERHDGTLHAHRYRNLDRRPRRLPSPRGHRHSPTPHPDRNHRQRHRPVRGAHGRPPRAPGLLRTPVRPRPQGRLKRRAS